MICCRETLSCHDVMNSWRPVVRRTTNCCDEIRDSHSIDVLTSPAQNSLQWLVSHKKTVYLYSVSTWNVSKALRYSMHCQGITQFYPHTQHFIRKRNEPYLPLPSQPQLVLIYRPRRDGSLSRPWCEVARLRFEPATSRLQIRHSTTQPLANTEASRVIKDHCTLAV